MLNTIKSLFKKFLDVFAVTGNLPKVEYIDKTSRPGGASYRITDASGASRDVSVYYNDDAYDLTATCYVIVKFDETVILRGRPALRLTKIDQVLSEEDHEALVRYFTQGNAKVIRLYPSPPQDTGKATACTPLVLPEQKL